MKKLFIIISALICFSSIGLLTANAVSTLFSQQVGTGPVAGSVLQTNGVTSTWVATSSLGISGGGGSANASGTIDQGAIFNGSSTLTSNNIQYVPANYAQVGCAGSSTATTFQGCVYAIYASMAPVGGGTIMVTNDVTSTWTGLLSFNINGDQVSLDCTANTILQYTGTGNDNADGWLPTGSNIALNFDFGNPIGHAQTSNSGDCDMRGSPSLIAAGNSMTATSTGVWMGGTWSYTSASQTATTTNAGAVGVNLDYNINGFGRNLGYGANAYLDNFTGTSSGGNCSAMTGCLLFFSAANNSGERWVMQGGGYTDPGNSTTTDAVYLTNAGTASIFFNFNSLDDAQIVCGASDGQCDVSSNHIENPAYSTYGAYIPIYNPSSDRSTSIIASFEEFANDTSGSNSFQTLIKHGGQLTAIGDHIDNYGGGTIASFSDHSNDNGVESEMICMLQVQSGGLTNIVAGNGNIAYSLQSGNGCVFDEANSYPLEWTITSGNVIQLNSGVNVVGAVDHNGNWTLGIAGTSGSLNVQGNVNATGTITQNGIALSTVSTSTANTWTALQTFGSGATLNSTTTLASTTNALLSTNASGTIVATTSYVGSFNGATGTVIFSTSTFSTSSISGTSGTIPMFSGTQNLINSILSQLGSAITALGNLFVSGTLNVTSTATFQATSTFLGNVSTTIAANSFVATNGQGILVATGTPSGGVTTSSAGTINTLPIWTSASALGNSTISGTSTVTIAASTTNIGSATTTFQIFSNGHINSTGTVAQVSSCGSSPSIRGTDTTGEVTDGSGTDTSCTVTFQYAYGAKPIVTVTPETAGISNFGYSYTTSTITVTATSLTSDVWDYTVYAHE